MNPDPNRTQYPYSRNRVFLSAVIAMLSTIFALTLLLSDSILVLQYFFATFIVVVITFFLKRRLYSYLVTGDQAETEDDTKRSSWKILLITLLMLVGSIGIPMLSALFLSGPVWFIMITSFITGVSISEIIIYVRSESTR